MESGTVEGTGISLNGVAVVDSLTVSLVIFDVGLSVCRLLLGRLVVVLVGARHRLSVDPIWVVFLGFVTGLFCIVFLVICLDYRLLFGLFCALPGNALVFHLFVACVSHRQMPG